MWIRVTRAADYRLSPTHVQAFKPGTYNVPRQTGKALIKVGAAETVENPKTSKAAQQEG